MVRMVLQNTALVPPKTEIISSHLTELCNWLEEKKSTKLGNYGIEVLRD
jgi:hypothetical protein